MTTTNNDIHSIAYKLQGGHVTIGDRSSRLLPSIAISNSAFRSSLSEPPPPEMTNLRALSFIANVVDDVTPNFNRRRRRCQEVTRKVTD